jgi:hypothetical protein
MKNSHTKKVIMVLSIIALVGFAAYAFADWGMGYGRQGMGMYGRGMGYSDQGWGQRSPNWNDRTYNNQGYRSNLRDNKTRKINPNAARSFDGRGGMGYGMMGSGMMNYNMMGSGGYCNW